MWDLLRLREFNRAYHSVDAAWDRSEAIASLQFAHGLMFSCLLVTPFWTAVGLLLHHLTR
jgi:hypothetical protein